MRASILAGAMAAAAVAIAVVLMFVTMAHSHETMGTWGTHGMMEYLYGHRVGNAPDGGKINCCLFNNGTEGSRGDCQRYPDEDVKIVPGGYLLKDGEFISQIDTSVSPLDPVTGEYHFYRCRHTPGTGFGDNPATHCWFAPPTGS